MQRTIRQWRGRVRHGAAGLVALVMVVTGFPGGLASISTAEAVTYAADSDLTVVPAMTGAQLDAAIRAIRSDSGLIGLGDTFVRVGTQYRINPIYLAAHAAWESTWGTSTIARDKNNIYGWTAYDSCPYACATTFSSKSACIETVVPVIKANYLTPGGRYYTSYGPTLRGMNVHYATDPNWKNGIASVMNTIAGRIGTVTPPPAPTPPADACTGTACNGLDPAKTVCATDGSTVASQSMTFGSGTGATTVLVELRWSSACKTNWVRAQVTAAPSGQSPLTLTADLEDANGQQIAGTQATGTSTNVYGSMWYAPTQQVRACVAVSGPLKGSVCTKLT